MKRVWLAIVVALLVYSTIDILVWQRIFEDEQRQTTVLKDEIFNYQAAWQIALVGLIAVGSIGFWKEKPKMLFFAGATLTLAHSGLEDVLYYLLDGKTIPHLLPWLNHAPLIIKFGAVTASSLLISTCIWLIFWLLLTLIIEVINGWT